MREILFKAKRIDNEEWVEGYYCIKKPYCFDNRTGSKSIIITEHSSTGTVSFEVSPDTICQYTGLNDNNGNKIWENDIVRCYAVDICNREYEFASDVFWDDCMWMLHENEFCDNMLCHFDMSKNWVSHIPEIEVIGNIFDNPELLQ